MSEESEQMWPVVKHLFAPGAHLWVGAAPIPHTISLHPSPHKDRGIAQLPAIDVALTEGMPALEDMPDLLEQVFG